MSRNKVCASAFCAFALIATAAHADDEDTIGALGRIQTHTIILLAKAKEKDAQAQLDGKITANGMPTAAATPSLVDSTPPNVKMIVAGDAGPTATFIYAGGVEASGKVGAKIPGGYKIQSISAANRSVEVIDGKGHPMTLGMSSSAPVAPVTQATPSQFGGSVRVPGAAPMMGSGIIH